jgi:proteasome lid subunit RPN8/RPN11
MLSLIDFAPLRPAIEAHASQVYPHECCGLVTHAAEGLRYHPCRNTLADTPAGQDRFQIHHMDWAAAEDAGELAAVVHSHPNESAHPSQADRVMCERTELPWLIIGWPHGVMTLTEPQGWRAPLIGRDFHHGVLDCYTLIRDYYAWDVGIELPDFERDDDWWAKGQNLYRDGFEAAGFVEVPAPMQRHDVLLMMAAARVENHGAVWLGDGTILHHLYGRLSCKDVWGGDWERRTTAVLRHQSLLAQQPGAL